MRWSDGLHVSTDQLRAQAAGLHSSHSALTTQHAELESVDVSHWEGRAGRAERVQHERILRTIRRQAESLPPIADALSEAADSFDDISHAQVTTIGKANRWGFAIADSGWISNEQKLNPDPRRAFVYGDLVTSVTSLTLRLNGCDLVLAGKLVFQGAKSTVLGWGDSLSDAGDWIGNKVADGLDWTLDKGSDLLTNVEAFLARRALSTATALERLRDFDENPPQWLKDWDDNGKPPYMAEVAARGLHRFGLRLGMVGNALMGRDLHVFDDGEPYVGEVTLKESGPYSGLGDVMETVMDTYDRGNADRNSINVTAVEDEHGNVRYIASIPGTAEGTMGPAAWMGAPSGLDWAANAMHVGSGPTAATHAASQAIQDAIAADIDHRKANGLSLPQGAPEVLLAGHSQGGIIAGQLLTSDEFLTGLDVKGIVSAGAPQQTLPMNADVPVYNFQGQYDPIPRLDLGGVRSDFSMDPASNVTNITLPHSGPRTIMAARLYGMTPWYTHAQDTYEADIKTLQSQGTTSQATQDLGRLQDEFGAFFTGRTTSYDVEFGREVGN
ncbi:MAG: WXG100 family type VII secretion target [Propionibacteriaceae bacterium]|nr:WXG100 family type VII secretion target [Propionibacteriaceae bacterium]